MMTDRNIHLNRLWKVDEIAKDFHLWDVWELPITADNSKGENFRSFYKIFVKSFSKVQGKYSITAFLFGLRNLLGKIFRLDRNINSLPIPGCKEKSVRTRLNNEDFKKSTNGQWIKDEKSELAFIPVYLFENESLHEISNDTVHGLIHFGWIRAKNGFYTATMSIYIKPRGIIGRVYLKIIQPFRHYIVYPALIKSVRNTWQEHQKLK